MFYLTFTWINWWINGRDRGNLRRYQAMWRRCNNTYATAGLKSICQLNIMSEYLVCNDTTIKYSAVFVKCYIYISHDIVLQLPKWWHSDEIIPMG